MVMNKLTEIPTKENPLVMYIVVRKSLNMSVGKLIAQVGHGVQYCILTFSDLLHYHYNGYANSKEIEICHRMNYWYDPTISNSRKVSLTADDKEWEKLKSEYLENDRFLVKDQGLTEIPEGSETVMVFWPMLKSERSKTLKRCRTL